MGQLSSKLRSAANGVLIYWCQGCEGIHSVHVGEGDGPRWGYNGDPERPTFDPSVRVTYNGPDADIRRAGGARAPSACCHTYITDGMVRFLGDCSHALAGQTLPLPDLPPELRDAGDSTTSEEAS